MSGATEDQGRRSFVSRALRSRETGIILALIIMVIGLSVFAPDFRFTRQLPQ
jgi:hypothetical protein